MVFSWLAFSASCQRPKAFFAPTGPIMHPVDKKSPVAVYCTMPYPPFVELGILTMRIKDGKYPDIGVYVRRLGANGIVYDIIPPEDDVHKMLLIDRNWPHWYNDVNSGNATVLQDDILHCAAK